MSWQVKSMMVGMIPRSLPFKGSPHLSPSKSFMKTTTQFTPYTAYGSVRQSYNKAIREA